MSPLKFSPFMTIILPYLVASLLYNSFGFKLFIDIGSYDILDTYLFFHYIISLFISICLSIYPIRKVSDAILFTFIPITSWPTLSMVVFYEAITISHLFFYIIFLQASMLAIYFMTQAISNHATHLKLFYSIFIAFLLWGSSIIIEALPYFYEYIAPLTLSYHFTLVATGILHIGTVIYMVLLPLFFMFLPRIYHVSKT